MGTAGVLAVAVATLADCAGPASGVTTGPQAPVGQATAGGAERATAGRDPAADAGGVDALTAPSDAASGDDADPSGAAAGLPRETIQFFPHSDTVPTTSEAALARVVASLRSQPAVRLEVRGHADPSERGPGSRDLGLARANAVVRALVAQGVARPRLLVRSYGASQPVQTDDSAEARARNGRVELVGVP